MVRSLRIDSTDEEILQMIKDDTLGRWEDIRRFLKLVASIEGSYSIFINAQWGDGKTSFVRMVIKILEQANHIPISSSDNNQIPQEVMQQFGSCDSYIPIYFNAWKMDYQDDPLCALLMTIDHSFNKMFGSSDIDLAEVMRTVLNVALEFAVAKTGIEELKDLEAITSSMGKMLIKNPAYAEFLERTKLKEKIVKAFASIQAKTSCTVILFIDELDRCRPEFAVRLLEQTKHFLEVDNLVIVYSTDLTQLSFVVGNSYGQGFDADKYFSRFRDTSFYLTPINYRAHMKVLGQNDIDNSYLAVMQDLLDQLGISLRDNIHLKQKLPLIGNLIVGRDVVSLESFAYKAILPVMIVIEEFYPQLWMKIRRGEDLDQVFEIGRISANFLSITEDTLHYIDPQRPEQQEFFQREFVTQAVTLIYDNDADGARYENACSAMKGLSTQCLKNPVFHTL